jgi:hypothetical protein
MPRRGEYDATSALPTTSRGSLSVSQEYEHQRELLESVDVVAFEKETNGLKRLCMMYVCS